MSIVNKLVNENLATLKPYESARRLYSGGQHWLNANESPFSNQYSIDTASFNRYPSCQPDEVVNNYAEYAQVSNEELIVTRGADEGIELLIRTFCTPGKDKILICPPTYGMYAISAETIDIGVKKAPLLADFNLDVPAICAHNDVNIVFICAPNNPTGTRVKREDVIAILNHFKDSALVVLDEAYIEFDPTSSFANDIKTYDNLVVLRTLSKAFALAGLRCGFTLASKEIIQALLKVIAPYPIPEPVAQIASQAVDISNRTQITEQVEFINQAKQALASAIAQKPEFTLIGDTHANFVLFKYKESAALMKFLVSNGMLIRDQSKQLNLQNCLRATVGTAEQNAHLLNLIDTFLAQVGQPK